MGFHGDPDPEHPATDGAVVTGRLMVAVLGDLPLARE